jgi:hypothetical protein
VRKAGKRVQVAAVVVLGGKDVSVGHLRSVPTPDGHTPLRPIAITADSSAPERMDTLKAINGYLDKMIGEVPGMKVLLLDGHTVRSFLRA